jgi:hypothetical protein
MEFSVNLGKFPSSKGLLYYIFFRCSAGDLVRYYENRQAKKIYCSLFYPL